MIACVAVIGKSNNPLFIRSFNSQTDELKFHYIVHSALDVIEDKCKETNSVQCYLGLLYPTEDFRVFGYITNTNIKLVMVMDETEIKDTEVKAFFEKFHAIFVDIVCNPFYNLDEKIEGKKFLNEIVRLVTTTSSAI